MGCFSVARKTANLQEVSTGRETGQPCFGLDGHLFAQTRAPAASAVPQCKMARHNHAWPAALAQTAVLLLLSFADERTIYLALELDRSWTEMGAHNNVGDVSPVFASHRRRNFEPASGEKRDFK
jgi:hypothetical protein